MIDDLRAELTAGDDGARALRNKHYNREVFGRMLLSRFGRDGDCEIANVQFDECRSVDGQFDVFGAVRLRDVSLRNLVCGEYWFHADNLLDNVSISGGAKSRLWVREPMDEKGNRTYGVKLCHPISTDGTCLDISGYLGEVVISNADPRNIRINPEIHAVYERSRLATVQWRNDKSLPEAEFVAAYVKADRSATGVFIGGIMDGAGKVNADISALVTELRRRGVVD